VVSGVEAVGFRDLSDHFVREDFGGAVHRVSPCVRRESCNRIGHNVQRKVTEKVTKLFSQLSQSVTGDSWSRKSNQHTNCNRCAY
jgi:hypothetical protein